MEQNTEIRQELEIYLDTIDFLNESTDDYFYLWDFGMHRIHFSEAIHREYSLPYHGKDGNTIEEWEKVIYSRDLKAFEREVPLIESGEEAVHDMEYRIVDKFGNKKWVSCRGKSRFYEDGTPKLMIGRISSSVLVNKADALTGLLNTNKFMEDMMRCKEHGCSGYLMILGIDNFKHINIQYGRNYGNQILKRVTAILEENSDASMCIYRLDGDRFAVMFPGGTREMVESVYGDIRRNLKDYCTVSAGVVFCDSNSQDNEAPVDCGTIYQYAEVALDRAKQKGKDMLIFFSEDYYKEQFDRIRFQEELGVSVKNHMRGFYLKYQPMVDCRTFRVCGAEALLRYDSLEKGKMSPVDFIPILEQTELICPAGEWVLRTAAEQCREWRKVIPDFHINVNMSYVQLRSPGIAEIVLDIVKEAGIPGDALTLEVTESMQLQDYCLFNQIFCQWKEYGITIALDDFGTGYSSLSYLKGLEVDEIKIDRCFVNNIQNSAYNHHLLSNVIELAYSAGIKVCCEGVETEEELAVLKELRPDLLQGYYFAKPCEENLFTEKYLGKVMKK